MLIQSCSVSVFFPPNRSIREHLFDLERHFLGFQKPFTLVPLPPDAPNELPRIVAISSHGHSQLLICGNSAQLNTKFDGAFNQDIKKCIEYVGKKSSGIVEALAILDRSQENNPRFYYSGMTMVISFDEADGIHDPANYISQNFFKCLTNLPTQEVQFRLAFTVEDKYFINIMLQNNRNFAGAADERGSFVGVKLENEDLRVTLDVNDKYAFNKYINYFSSVDSMNHIAKIMETFSSERLVNFVKGADLNYE